MGLLTSSMTIGTDMVIINMITARHWSQDE